MTGGSRGIGAAVVQDLTSRGYEVFALSRSGDSNVGTAVACDVSNELELTQACASILSHGPVSLLVNNAGAYSARRSAELSAEEYNRIINLNATSMMVASRELYPGMRDQGGGLIINMGSFFDRLGAVSYTLLTLPTTPYV